MALRGYELLLFVRAQNQASGTLRRVANDVRALNRETSRMGSLQQAGRLTAHIGRAAQLTGLVATAALGSAAKAAADFGSEVTLAASQARDLDAPLAQVAHRAEEIDDQIKTLMRTFPAASSEMSASAYEIYSGINLFNNGLVETERAMYAMTLANKAAVAGQADLADSTSLLITLANNFGDSEADMAANMDTAFDIIRFGRLRVGELNDMLNKIAPAAKASGQSLEQLGGATAYLTTVIPSQRQVATGMSRLLDVLRHPDMAAGFEQFGVRINDAKGNMLPFMDIMAQLIKTFPELERGEVNNANFFRTISQRGRQARTGAPGLGLVSTIEGRRIFTQLVTGWQQVLERQKQVEQNTNELNTAYAALSESAGVRFQRFVNNLKRQMLDIGVAVIPVFEEIGRHLGRLSKWWESLDSAQRDNIVRWTAMAGVLLIVGGAIASVIGALTAMVGTFGIFFGTRGINPQRLATLGRFAFLLRAIKGVGTIAAVSLIFKAAITGDATAIQLLQGALAGGAAGFAFGGPIGALVGAITVPLVMKLSTQINKPDTNLFAKLIAEDFNKNFQGQKWVEGDVIRDQWTRTLSQLHLYNIFNQATAGDFVAIMQKARASGEISGAQFAAGMKIAIAMGLADIQNLTFAAAEVIHDPASSVGQIAADNAKRAGKAEKAVQTSNLKAWDKYFADLAKFRNADKERATKAADVVGDATKAAVDELSGFLIQKYQEMEQQNKQFMGSLFQGEWLTGEAARISEEWGIKPMMKDLIKDMRMQLGEFNRFNAAIAAIAKRGGPPELIEELKALGPAGLEQLEVLRKASPKAFNEFVRVYRQRQGSIRKQTQIDFNKQLAQWKKHGGNMMGAIIAGLTAEHAKLEQYFHSMVGTWFPGFIASEVAAAQADAARNAPPAGPRKPKPPSSVDPLHRDPTGRRVPIIMREGDVHVTVYQQPGESSADVHRRAALALKAKVRKAKGKPAPKPRSSVGPRTPSRPTNPGRGD